MLLNPRAVVAEAREEDKSERRVDVKAKVWRRQAKDMPAIGGSPKGGGPRGGAGPSFSALDTDKDGKISREEAPEVMKGAFDQIDTDSDGAIGAQGVGRGSSQDAATAAVAADHRRARRPRRTVIAGG